MSRRKEQGRRAVLAGAALCGVAVMLMVLPLIWGRSSINKYFVAFGFVGFCAGMSFIAHGAWDWWRGGD
jgi:hypothetical protein